MVVKEVGIRWIQFTFNELLKTKYHCVTNMFVINAKDTYYICDTYLGPSYMRRVKRYLEERFGIKKYIVFNSHSHWDHIWGNNEFIECPIISHSSCATDIKLNGNAERDKWKDEFEYEDFQIIFPNTIFDEELKFEADGITFFHSPGHTEDSSSCYDSVDKVLFVADNIDETNPSYLNEEELLEYKLVLERYLNFDTKWIVHSHGDVTDQKAILKIIGDIDTLLKVNG